MKKVKRSTAAVKWYAYGTAVLLMVFCVLFSIIQVSAASGKPYLIKVNKTQNCITIYEKDKNGEYTVPVKAMVCSTGYATPLGTFKTPAKYRWKVLLDDVWGQYSTRIYGSILFHSVWYYQPDPSTLSAKQYNKLGTTCSHGCIRVTVEDAKWMYDNCPLGTTVVIYEGSDPGPLGKPKAIKLQPGTGWDPTDVTNSSNPFNKKKPVISGAKNQTLEYGEKFRLKDGVSAVSTTGFKMEEKEIKISGSVNRYKPGKYKITYSATDLLGRKGEKTVTYTVLPDKEKPIITGVKDKIVSKDTKLDRSFALKGVKASLHDKALNANLIKTKYIKKSNDLYTIEYTITAPNKNKTTAACTVRIDRKAPVIAGIKDKRIDRNQKVDRTFALQGISVSDDITKMNIKDIKVEIAKQEDNSYTITYRAKDAVGNITEKTAIYSVKNELRIEGVADKTVEMGAIVSEDYVKAGITAWDGDTNITEKLEVIISQTEDNVYQVTYYVNAEDGSQLEKSATFTMLTEDAISQSQTPEVAEDINK